MTKTLPYLTVTCALGLLLTSCSQSSQGSSRVTPSAAPDATMTPSGNVSKDLDVKTKVITVSYTHLTLPTILLV